MATLSFLVAIFASAATGSSLRFAGASVSLDGKDFFVSPFVEATVDRPVPGPSSPPFGFQPVSVIDSSVVSTESLFESWSAKDDVFTTSFTEAIVTSGEVPSGPYFLSPTGTLHRAYRLYRDIAGAFAQPLLQSSDGTFGTLSAHIPSSTSLTIGVPSRLYFNKTSDKPLAGARIGVKDVFALTGTKTGNGNREWYELYPPSDSTAPSIQRLIDAGAVVVGMQVASQFAHGEAATADWVDYHAPFNPRGDGYDQPAASSAGAGASIAAYDWLDLAVGTDTGGSIRAPAATQGLFGNRPSLGISVLGGVLPMSPTMDTIGLIARDPELLHVASGVLYEEGYGASASDLDDDQFPSDIFTLGYPETPEGPADDVMFGFADKLAWFLGGGNYSVLDLHAVWDKNQPAEVGQQSLDEYLNLTYAIITGKEQVPLVRDPFFADYAAANKGRKPFINPVPLTRWTYADTVTSSDLADHLARRSAFGDWFTDTVIPPSKSPSSCSSSIILRPLYVAEPWTRNEYFPDSGGPPFGFNDMRISPFSGVPDFVFPLGQAPVHSNVSGVEEMWPVSIGVMAAKGCDAMLGRLAVRLVKEGILRVPQTGREAFPAE